MYDGFADLFMEPVRGYKENVSVYDLDGRHVDLWSRRAWRVHVLVLGEEVSGAFLYSCLQ